MSTAASSKINTAPGMENFDLVLFSQKENVQVE
jgi:hypothetical protein